MGRVRSTQERTIGGRGFEPPVPWGPTCYRVGVHDRKQWLVDLLLLSVVTIWGFGIVLVLTGVVIVRARKPMPVPDE